MSDQPPLISDDAVNRLCDVIEGIAQALNGNPSVSDGSVTFGLVSIASAIDGLCESIETAATTLGEHLEIAARTGNGGA